MNYPSLDEKIRVNFFSGSKKRNSKSDSQNICAHLGTLTYNGFNILEDERVHRIRGSKCEKRYGKDIEMRNLLLYQQKIKMILYELFILKYPLKGVALRWGNFNRVDTLIAFLIFSRISFSLVIFSCFSLSILSLSSVSLSFLSLSSLTFERQLLQNSSAPSFNAPHVEQIIFFGFLTFLSILNLAIFSATS